MAEKQGPGTTGVNCKQLFAMITLRLHFNMSFPGIHAVPAQGWTLSGDLCWRAEHLLVSGGVFSIAVMFYSMPQLELEAQSVTWAQQTQWSV